MSPSQKPLAQIGVSGLAVMGSNIARNFARHGYTVALHNRSVAKTDALLAEHGSDGSFVRSETIEEFIAALEKPRRVLIMVKAGAATDAVINDLADAMDPGDIIIDGGNALYTDTIRREKAIREYSEDAYYERLMAVYTKAIELNTGRKAWQELSPRWRDYS